MAEPLDPSRPKPATPAYLPRLWKTEPEPEEVEPAPPVEPEKKKKKKRAWGEPDPRAKAKAKKKKAGPDAEGAGKLEETPILDTYEARQKIRWIIGGLLGSIGLVGLVLALNAFRNQGASEAPVDNAEPPPLVSKGQPSAEPDAKALVEGARKADKAGKPEDVARLLDRTVKTFPGTAAAAEATQALDRHRKNLPPFGADPRPLALGPRSPTPKAAAPGTPSPTPSPVAPSPPAATASTGTLPGPTAPAPPRGSDQPGPTGPALAVANPPAGVPTRPLGKVLPDGFREKPGAPVHASGWPSRILSDRDGAIMLLVPAGSFLMGREDGEPEERPAHRVTLSTYYIDQHEVTVRQFAQFLRETGRPLDTLKNASKETADTPVSEDHPVVNVSSLQARAYCNWARKRLPTEAQWEFAARSTDGRISYWNGELPRKDPPKGGRTVEPVMTLPTDLSPFGVFDLAANAWEWTSEFYDPQYYQQFRATVADPTGPKQSRSRAVQMTVKGGSSGGVLTWRDGLKVDARLPYLGFRGVLPVEGTPAAPVAAPAPKASPNPGLPGGVVPF